MDKDRYTAALAELELYIQEQDTMAGVRDPAGKGDEGKQERKRMNQVPNRDPEPAGRHGPGGDKGKARKKAKEDSPGSGLSGPVKKGIPGRANAFLHYRNIEQAVPSLSLGAAEAAAEAIRELEGLKASFPKYLVMYIDDDGHRELKGAASLHEAKVYAETAMKGLLDGLEEEGRMQEVYIDDGKGGPYEPTPQEFINDDESHKCEADALGLLHVFRGEMYYIVYNELAQKTSRWDIFPAEGAFLGDTGETDGNAGDGGDGSEDV